MEPAEVEADTQLSLGDDPFDLERRDEMSLPYERGQSQVHELQPGDLDLVAGAVILVELRIGQQADAEGFLERSELDVGGLAKRSPGVEYAAEAGLSSARHREGMVGEVGTSFTYNRQALLDSIGRVTREVIGSYDREAEARAIANDVQGTFATTALAQVGALGLGTLVVTLLTGAVADVTGLLLATTLAVSGFYVIPRRRRQAQREFSRRIDELRQRLRDGLTRQVHLEIGQSADRINEAIAPYRRFVQSTQQELTDARGSLVATEDSLLRLRAEIERT